MMRLLMPIRVIVVLLGEWAEYERREALTLLVSGRKHLLAAEA